MNIKFNDLPAQWNQIKCNTLPKIERVLETGCYIDGPYIKEFETAFAKEVNSKYAIGVSNGTDALKLCIQALNLSGNIDVIIPANTYIADALAIYHQKTPHNITLIDCNIFYQIDIDLLSQHLKDNRNKYTECIILPVHLYGHPADMENIKTLAEIYNCYIIEDASQAHFAICNNKLIGEFGCMTAYSLYPGKNLGACGDAGIITTNNENHYKKLLELRNYGSIIKYHHNDMGWNNRLDTIQAVILNEKLKNIYEWNTKRNIVARNYNNLLIDCNGVILPKTATYVTKNVYHIYPIRTKLRNKLQNYLSSKNIPTVVHYPIPIQKTKAFNYLDSKSKSKKTIHYANELLSLPIHPYITETEIIFITNTIKDFFKNE